MIITKNQLRLYLKNLIKESIQNNPNVGMTNINGEDFIVYNNLTHFQEFAQQIIAGQTEGATGFGQYFEQVMLGFLDNYNPLNTDGFNFPFADIYREEDTTILYSVKMKRKIDPNAIGGGKIQPSQIRASLNNYISQRQFVDKEIQYGLVSGEIDPASFGKVRHIGLPIKLTQFMPTSNSPIFSLRKTDSQINSFGGLAVQNYMSDYNPNPYYPINESKKIKNSDNSFYYITVKNTTYENAAKMLGEGIEDESKPMEGQFSKLSEWLDGYAISADDAIFDIKSQHPLISDHPDVKSVKILIKNNPESASFINRKILPKTISATNKAITTAKKPSTKVISTKDEFIKLFMNGSKREIPILNVIITGGFTSAQEAINYLNTQSSPPTNILSVVQEIDKMIALALPTKEQAQKDVKQTRIISLMLMGILGSPQKMIEETSLADPENFPNGFFCRVTAAGTLVFNFSKDLGDPLLNVKKGDYQADLIAKYKKLKAEYEKYKEDLKAYNEAKKLAKRNKQPFTQQPPVPVPNPGAQGTYVKKQKPYPDPFNKAKKAQAASLVLKILLQKILSGIAGIDYLFQSIDPKLVQKFKLECQQFYLLKKVSDDSLQGKVMSAQDLIEHQKRIEEYRRQVVLPIAKQVLPQEIGIVALSKTLTFSELLEKLNLGPVATGDEEYDKEIIPESLQLVSNEAGAQEVVEMITALGDLLDLIIQIAIYDMNTAISLLSGKQQISAAESKVYEKILTELLKYSRR